LKQVSRLFLGLSILYTLLICALGTWWLYLIVQYGGKLSELIGDHQSAKVVTMVKWEGLTFFALLLLLTASLLILYYKDIKKTKSLQAFFASMTHELKTPLASVKLQGEVLSDSIDRIDYTKIAQNHEYLDSIKEKVNRLSGRLVEDANKLEATMDKILHLSRLEGGGELHLTKIDLKEIFKEVLRGQMGFLEAFEVHEQWHHTQKVWADEFALTLIFKNLLENTLIHSPHKKVWIETKDTVDGVELIYEDKGQFTGDITKLGNLFYKHNSKKGSGIGLYLTKTLMQKMNGQWKVQTGSSMRFFFTFKKGGEYV